MSELNYESQFSWLNAAVVNTDNIIAEDIDRDHSKFGFNSNDNLFKRISTTIKHSNKIVAFHVHESVLLLALSHGIIYVYDVKSIENIVIIESIDLHMESNNSINRIFVDSKCSKVLVTLKSSKCIFINLTSVTHCYVPHLEGYTITSLTWIKNRLENNDNTSTILFGTNTGLLFESYINNVIDSNTSKNKKTNHDEISVHKLFKVDDDEFPEIKSVHFSVMSIRTRTVHCVIATPKRLYQFVGLLSNDGKPSNNPLLKSLFENYNNKPSFIEFPNSSNTGGVEIIYDSKQLPSKFIWQSGSRVMYGHLNIDCNGMKANSIIAHVLLLPKDCDDKIISIVATNYHCLILYPLRMLVISLINMSIVSDETLGTFNGRSVGVAKDSKTQQCWYFTDYRAFVCNTENEDRNIWQSYMNEGMFVEAKIHCKENPNYLKIVTKHEADWFFTNKKYIDAAKLYAIERENFEEASLKFLSLEDTEPLLFYLNQLLSRLGQNDTTQMVLVLNWLIRVNLNQLVVNSAADNFVQLKREVYDYIQYLFSNKNYLNCIGMYRTLFYQILQQCTDHELFITLANKLNDYKCVLCHFVDIGDYTSAMDILNKCKTPSMIYEYSNSLIRHNPQEVVTIWMEMRNSLEPRKILDTIKYFNSPRYSHIMKQVVRYIEFCIETLKCLDKTVHNHLITLYCSLKDYTALYNYITTTSNDDNVDAKMIPAYDLQFALSLCHNHNQNKCCVHILASMMLYDEAVELALKIGDIPLAKCMANKPEDDDLKKKLWLNVAEKTLVGSKDIGTSMEFLKESKLLKIEDILQFFDDFTYIDQFRDAICESLEDYNKEIDTLTKQMNNYMQMSNQLKFFSHNLQKRHITINLHQVCDGCSELLLHRPFYAFPCSHAYHQDCFIKQYYAWVDEKKRIMLKKLMGRLFQSKNSQDDAAPPPISSSNINEDSFEELLSKFKKEFLIESSGSPKMLPNKRNSTVLNNTKKSFDSEITQQCLMCGEITLNLIDLPVLREKSLTEVN